MQLEQQIAEMKNSSKAEAGESKEAVERKTDHLLSRLRALEAAKGVAPVAADVVFEAPKEVEQPKNDDVVEVEKTD